MDNKKGKTLRLILGDQLNPKHSWFSKADDSVTYVLMELRSETDYACHHIQKVAAFFAAMRDFSKYLASNKHRVIYLKINDQDNLQTFGANLGMLIAKNNFSKFEYQLPDEFRVDQLLKSFCADSKVASSYCDTEHFFTTRDELGAFFSGKKMLVMENFYHYMRKKHGILMQGNQPLTGQWNYDHDNRSKLPKSHVPLRPLEFSTDVTEIVTEIKTAGIKTIGTIDAKNFIWPINRAQSLELLDFFAAECLPLFGTFQDAMQTGQWSLYHSRISFSLNTKMLSPAEVIETAIAQWERQKEAIAYHQLEGFVRQILGWREYMRGIYWLRMPGFAAMNFFGHTNGLPKWYWDGKTKMNCLKNAISLSLTYAYAHHIQRLMVTGNFALLAQVDPDAVDAWYLGIYIDAIEWVEITNTRGMSQFADGGITATKPYVSSASYINKMSNYCSGCYYDKNKKTGYKACPFNSLYWNFFDRHQKKLGNNARLAMMYKIWNAMKPADKEAVLQQAAFYLKNIDAL